MRADDDGLDRISDSTDTLVTMTQSKASTRPGQVRIIAGAWRRTPLPVPDRLGLRPSPDRVRVTVFNWIEHLLPCAWGNCHVLDAFAGTGCLGIEAASRGAAQVTLVERDSVAATSLRQTLFRLQPNSVQLHKGDVVSWLAQQTGPFDLVFVDPPFGQGLVTPILELLSSRLSPSALVYLESELTLEVPAGWSTIREMKAGAVLSRLLQRDNRSMDV